MDGSKLTGMDAAASMAAAQAAAQSGTNVYPTPYSTLPMGAAAAEVSGLLIDRFSTG